MDHAQLQQNLKSLGKTESGLSTPAELDPSHTSHRERDGRIDIEHVPVADDPRAWSSTKKHVILAIVASAAMIAGLGANIQNPSIQQMEEQLPATSSQISLSLSLFILIQGAFPLIWTAISEVKGRKKVYIASLVVSLIGSIVTALSKNIGLVIGFRMIQGAGSSAVISVGGATLADIFDPLERGAKVGIFYMAPLLGPSLGPIIGGALTSGFNWRASFWFMAIFTGLNLLSFLFLFKDTFRRERSLTYQNVLRSRVKALAASSAKASRTGSVREVQSAVTEKTSATEDVVHARNSSITDVVRDVDRALANEEKGAKDNAFVVSAEAVQAALPTIKLSLKDVNPIKPLWQVTRRLNNIIILIASGTFFAFGFIISYTTSRTLGLRYGYNAMEIGLVLLSFGVGSLGGSVIGGRWSDYALKRLTIKNGGKLRPEMRLRSTFFGLWLLPPSIIGFGWVSQQHVHISAICIMLFICGFLSIWIYASTLAYIVDANNGRSSAAMAANSAFRGLFAFVATEIAVPLQDAIGDGWMYTLWGGIMIISELMILLVMLKGGKWREAAEDREAESRH
ncbi:hypothetical protein HGRIS_007441 [Hohenbuehelia grisea]|uniref:Major facilitator superfamily (MFS) profile domain-containing protein n=1 Tax=Hohenbuehelia grisea TaxID=104357 RepID=A0ABR3J581_9AGAR